MFPCGLKEFGMPESLTELAACSLIADDPTSEGWLTWEQWFKALGVEPGKVNYGLRTCLYTDAVQAALERQGVTLGWSRVLHDHLELGRLVRVTDASLELSDGYYLVVPHGKSITPALHTLIQLLRAAVGITQDGLQLPA